MSERALPEQFRPARTIREGHEIRPTYGTWVEVTDRTDGPRGIVFSLADGTDFHAIPSQRIVSRYQPRQEA